MDHDMNEEEKQIWSGSRKKLYFSVFILNLVFFSIGCGFAWSSPTLPLLMSNCTECKGFNLTITENEASWVASLIPLGNILGPFIAGLLLNTIGRKWTMLVDVIILLGSWIVLSLTFSVYMLFIGRFFMGISVGITFTAIPLYIAEIAEDHIRGPLNNIMQIFIPLSIVTVYAIGPVISYFSLIIISCIPCILFLALFPWLPETPYYLVSKKRNDIALQTLYWIRGGDSGSTVQKEIKVIQAEISESLIRKSSFKDLISQKGTQRALFITSFLLAFQQLTGISVVIFYAESIFKMTGTPISSSLCTLLVGSVMLAMGCFGPLVIAKFGYKKPLIASAIGMIISHTTMGIYLALYLREFEYVNNLNWIPIVGMNVFIIFHTLGFSFVPWTLMGELFSPEIKSLAAATNTSICAGCSFIISNLFPNIVSLVGIDGVFFIFGTFSILGLAFVVYYVPNTSQMSLAEIQDLMSGKSKKSITK